MKILMVISSLTTGGAERVCSFLANRWCKNHEIVLVTLKGYKYDFFSVSPDVKRYAIGIERKRWFFILPTLFLIIKLRKIILEEKPNYIISFVIKTNIFTLLSLLGTEYPIIVTEHSIIMNRTVDWKQHLFRNLLYKRSNKITVLSSSIKNEMIKVYPSINSEKIIVVPNPFIEPTQELHHNIARGKVIITVGRIVPLKRIDLLVKAFKLFVNENSDFRLTIIGDGPERNSIEKLIQEEQLSTQVTMLGFIKDIYEYLYHASLFVLTSEHEGFGLVLLEAMYASLPIVAFDVPGVRDVIESGKNGILVPFGDILTLAKTMHMLIHDEELQKKLIKEGKETLKKYSPKNIDNIWFKKVLIEPLAKI